MKFLYSDTQDYVDPDYDFLSDQHGPNREKYWTDRYAHELMTPAPYDGLLVSMSAVRQAQGVASSKVRYSTKEEQRLLRDGARRFLRFDGPRFQDLMLMGDCGAFAYVQHPEPAYKPEEVEEFYEDAGFTHGISPDHIIFDCDPANPAADSVSADTQQRFEITLSNARDFLNLTPRENRTFEPLGAVQGWSPDSMADAALQLEHMGYKYLAIGGLVPLKVPLIKNVLEAIRRRIRPSTKLHLLGFAKAEQIHEFMDFGITSFDSTSPLIRAFKDQKSNYYLPGPEGGLAYYSAIRIPQAIDNTRLVRGIKQGRFNAEDLLKREALALNTLRQYDKSNAKLEDALEAVMDYHQFLLSDEEVNISRKAADLVKMRTQIQRTLEDRPWRSCSCDICSTVGIEVIIFRSSNRNKRRGFHNLGVYHRHLHETLEREAA